MINKEQYFRQVYRQTKDKIYRLCLGFVGNQSDADDLFQETMIKVWENLDSFNENSAISTWIYRISTNTALLFIKKKNISDKKTSPLKPEDLNLELNESDVYAKELKSLKLYQCISELKDIDRIIIGLLLENCSYQEISEITGLTTSNIGARINRIKINLTKKMKNLGD